MAQGNFMCHECHGSFPTALALAQHTNEHDMLRQLQGNAGPATRGRTSLPPLDTKPRAHVPPKPDGSKPKASHVSAGEAEATAPGLVDFFDDAKGFGFLRRTAPGARSGQVYFHITSCDVKRPFPSAGEVVAFQEGVGPKGPIATSVVRATVCGDAGSSEARHAPTPGVVQYYNAHDGTGYLSCVAGSGGGRNVAFHITDCDIQTPAPRVGERVTFTRSDGPNAMVTQVTRPEVSGVVEVGSTSPSFDAAVDQSLLRPEALLLGPVKDKFKKLARAPSTFKGGANPRYVYVDLDNIYVSLAKADHLVSLFPGATSVHDLQLDLQGFTRRLAEGSNGVPPARLVAFYFNTPESVASKLRVLSFNGVAWDVRKQETTSDTSMQLELLNAKHRCDAHPKTLVLVTGDGNVAPNGMCFREILDKYLLDGWAAEIHGWMFSMHTGYIVYQDKYPSAVVIRPFDDEHIGDVVRIRGRSNFPQNNALTSRVVANSPVDTTTKPARGRPDVSRHVKQEKSSKPKPLKPKKVAWNTDILKEKASVPLDDNEEEKRAIPDGDDHDGDDDDEEYVFAQLDRHAFTVALLEAVQESRSTPYTVKREEVEHSVPPATMREKVMRPVSQPEAQPAPRPAPQPAAASNDRPTAATPPHKPEQLRRLIQQLEGPDGKLFIATAIDVLARTNTRVDVASLINEDEETQRMVLAVALFNEVEAANVHVTATHQDMAHSAPPTSAPQNVARPAPQPAPQPAPVNDRPHVATAAAPTPYQPEQFKRIIQHLESQDGNLFISTALEMLARSNARVDVASIRSENEETQRMLLALALEDEMDTATSRVIRAENAGA